MKKIFLSITILLIIIVSIAGNLTWRFYNSFLNEKRKTVNVIIAEHNGGQLCNQLWLFATIAAFCKENGYQLYNPSFFKYARHFESFHDDVLISPTHPCKLHLPQIEEIQRFVHRRLKKILINHCLENRFKPEVKLTLPPSSVDFPPLKAGNHFFYGWNFENPVGLEKHGDYIREILKPKKAIQRKIDRFWKEIDQDRLIIGVHIRHGDFRRWSGGKYFYPIEVYREHMNKILERTSSLNPLFIIYSDETWSADEFPGFDVRISQGNPVEDLYSLAKCDLIIGVSPSTYSGWAAWYGKVARYTIDNPVALTDIDSLLSKKIE